MVIIYRLLLIKHAFLLRYNTWVTNKKQEKVLLWYNLIGQTTIERRTNSCARIIPQKLTIVNVCLSMDRVKFFWEKSSAGIELPEFDASFE